MQVTPFDIVGYCGIVSLSFMLIPQVRQTYRQKTATHLNWTFLFLQTLASSCGFVYGIGVYQESDLATAIPLLVQNPCVAISSVVLIIMKIKYDGFP